MRCKNCLSLNKAAFMLMCPYPRLLTTDKCSVADPGCLSRILTFTHSGSQNSNKREGWKKFVVIPSYVATNFSKLKIILVLKCWRKKFGPIFKELYNFLRKKLSLSSQKYGFRGQKGTGSRIRNTGQMYTKVWRGRGHCRSILRYMCLDHWSRLRYGT